MVNTGTASAVLLIVAALQNQPDTARIRTEDPVLAASIESAIARSPTFHRLVDDVHATDGIVTIERGRCRRGLPACLLLWVGIGGPNRILRVVVDDRLRGDEAVNSLAHELSHVLEVLRERNVKSGVDMYFLFSRIGSLEEGVAFETKGANRVAAKVRRELSRSPER